MSYQYCSPNQLRAHIAVLEADLEHAQSENRALLDRAEKAEADNARLRRAIERKDAALEHCIPHVSRIRGVFIRGAIAYTGTDEGQTSAARESFDPLQDEPR